MALGDASDNAPKTLSHVQNGFRCEATERTPGGEAVLQIRGKFDVGGKKHVLQYQGDYADWATLKLDGNDVLNALIAAKQAIAAAWA